MKAILTITALLTCLAASGQQLRFKTHEDSTGTYQVRYEIDTARVAFSNEGNRHYEAVITVLEINEADTTVVYQPLRGIYAEQPCVCDDPRKIVDRFKKLNEAE